jgi:hypothetical protein
MPKENNNIISMITYSVSNKDSLEYLKRKRKSTWAYKSFYEVDPLLNKMQKDNIIEYRMFYNVDWITQMRLRKDGDIHIGDIYTGSYHLSELEGLSLGQVVLGNLADWMDLYLMETLDCTSIPIIKTDKDNLEEIILMLLEDKELIKKTKKLSREWMETYWKPEDVFNDYYNRYQEIL